MYISIQNFEIVGVRWWSVARSSLRCHYCHTFRLEVMKMMLLSFCSLVCFVIFIVYALVTSSVFSAVDLILIVCPFVCPSPPPVLWDYNKIANGILCDSMHTVPRWYILCKCHTVYGTYFVSTTLYHRTYFVSTTQYHGTYFVSTTWYHGTYFVSTTRYHGTYFVSTTRHRGMYFVKYHTVSWYILCKYHTALWYVLCYVSHGIMVHTL
jgi:hypothetical protein